MSLSHAMDRWPARVTSGKLVLNDAGACGIGVGATAGAVASTVPSAPIVNGVRTFAPIANDFAGCHIAPKDAAYVSPDTLSRFRASQPWNSLLGHRDGPK